MYQVLNRSTQIPVFTGSKAYAEAWLAENNFCQVTGKCLFLYELKKVKK